MGFAAKLFGVSSEKRKRKVTQNLSREAQQARGLAAQEMRNARAPWIFPRGRSESADLIESPNPVKPKALARNDGYQSVRGLTCTEHLDSGKISHPLLNGPRAVPNLSTKVCYTRVVGFLVSFDRSTSGEIFPVREGSSVLVASGRGARGEDEGRLERALICACEGAVCISCEGEGEDIAVRRRGSADELIVGTESLGLEHGDTLFLGARSYLFSQLETDRRA